MTRGTLAVLAKAVLVVTMAFGGGFLVGMRTSVSDVYLGLAYSCGAAIQVGVMLKEVPWCEKYKTISDTMDKETGRD